MIRSMVPVLVLMAACSGPEEVPEFHPTLEFIAPTDGGSVAAGDVQVSIVVEEFVLAAPEAEARATDRPAALPMLLLLEQTAAAHNEEGEPTGYVQLSLDDAAVGQMDTTQFTLVGVTAGSHVLKGELLFVDGDALEEPVSESITFDAE